MLENTNVEADMLTPSRLSIREISSLVPFMSVWTQFTLTEQPATIRYLKEIMLYEVYIVD